MYDMGFYLTMEYFFFYNKDNFQSIALEKFLQLINMWHYNKTEKKNFGQMNISLGG